MRVYEVPGAYTERVPQVGGGAIEGAATNITVIYDTFPWGPTTPVEVTTPGQALTKMGGYAASRQGQNSVQSFFDQGGRKAKLCRQVRYSSLANGTIAAAKATANLLSVGGTPTAATITGTVAPTSPGGTGWEIPVGATGMQFDLSLDGAVSVVTATVTATAATMLSGVIAAGKITVPLNTTWTMSLRSSPTGLPWNVAFTGAPVTGTEYTVAEIIDAINMVADSAKCVSAAGGTKIQLDSDIGGSTSYLELISGTAGLRTALGGHFATATHFHGAGNIESSKDFTPAELAAILLDADAHLIVDADVSPVRAKVALSVTGSVNKFRLKDTSLVPDNEYWETIFGWTHQDGATWTAGEDAAAAGNTGRIDGKYVGLPGNNLKVWAALNSKHVAIYDLAGSVFDLAAAVVSGEKVIEVTSLFGFEPEQIISLTDDVTVPAVRQSFIIESITTEVVAGVTHYYLNVKEAAAHNFAIADTAINSLDFDLEVYYKGSLVETWEQVNFNDQSPEYVETRINDEYTGSNWITFTDLDLVVTDYYFALPADSTDFTVLAGAADELASITVNDLIGQAVSKTGLYAVDNLLDIPLACFPGATALKAGGGSNYTSGALQATLINAALTYFEGRGLTFFVADVPEGFTPTQALAWRKNKGFNSAYGEAQFPMLYLRDPIGTGSLPLKLVPASAAICGLKARNDNIPPPDGGIHSASAGDGIFGQLYNVERLEYDVGDTDQALLNPVGINCIRNAPIGTPGIYAFGARSLWTTDKDWRYSSLCRLGIFIETSLRFATGTFTFRSNSQRNWTKQKARVDQFMRDLYHAGSLAGTKESDAWKAMLGVADGTMTFDNVDAGTQIGLLYWAGETPGEFLVWRVTKAGSGGVTLIRQ